VFWNWEVFGKNFLTLFIFIWRLSQNQSSTTMSGLGNFSLSSLGSMSTLGTLAQSAQRLDRLMAGNRSRQQEGNYGRNNSRRSVDDDFFGGRSSDRSRRRSPSPPRVNIKVDFSWKLSILKFTVYRQLS
jgi:hypothetical protein